MTVELTVERAVCVAAPNNFRRFLGRVGRLYRDGSGSVISFMPDGDAIEYLVPDLDPVHWSFSPEESAEAPVSRYDADSFAQDLDLAISRVVEIFNQWITANTPINPRLRAGMSSDDAIAETCMALVMRKATDTWVRQAFSELMNETRAMLITKNASYGDSALSPVRIWSKASMEEQIRVRLDDKVSRMNRGSSAGEDPANDALGYFILLLIAERRAK